MLILLTAPFGSLALITIVRSSRVTVADVTTCNNLNATADGGLDRHRKEPRAVHAPGVDRSLPQLVGSYDPGGVGVSEDGGCRPEGPLRFTYIMPCKPSVTAVTQRERNRVGHCRCPLALWIQQGGQPLLPRKNTCGRPNLARLRTE